jgi:NADPH:quinone reductase-like Zn-dependent oxidoreductase
MNKIVIYRPGGYARLRLEQHPDPRPGPGEVLVAVRSIGVSYADCVVRMGLYASAKELAGYPITPGFEAAGEVAAVGEGVEDLALGTPVLGITLFGGYASHLVLPRGKVFPLPHNLPLEQAGGFPTMFLTAWTGLVHLAHARRGERVLIHSAAGGVGSALVQLARLQGCRTVGVVGARHKVAAVKALGADAVIDKSSTDLWSEARRLAPEGYDLVLDANGVETLMQSYRHLAPLGRLVVYGFHSMLPRGGRRRNWLKLAWKYWRTPCFDPLRMTNSNRSVLAFNLSYLTEREALLREALGQLLGWMTEGKLRMPPTTVFPLRRAADAQRALESGQTVGKLILVP